MPINAAETPIIAVVIFALWTAILAFAVPIWRMVLVMSGQARTTDFTPGDAHGSPAYWRLNRAHANCVENLVVFAALAVCGLAAGISDTNFGVACFIILIARLLQSSVHIVSGSGAAVGVRFAAFAIQCIGYLVIGAMTLARVL
ncbi:MAG: MAPEG family protein [Caulobacterales bacterium]